MAHVPKATISELKDQQFGCERISPKEMLDHLEEGIKPTNILSLNNFMDIREAKMDFKGESGLTEFFKDTNEFIRRLEKNHKIGTSYTTLTARCLYQIEKHRGYVFRQALREWWAKDTVDTMEGFSRSTGSRPTRTAGATSSTSWTTAAAPQATSGGITAPARQRSRGRKCTSCSRQG